MPAILIFLGQLLLALAPSILGMIIARLGLGLVTYAGVSFFIDNAKSLVFSNFTSAPPLLIQFFGILQLGTVINIWFSAIVVRAVMNGLRSDGVMKKLVVK